MKSSLFRILVSIYQRYRFEDNFEGTLATLEENSMGDAEDVWHSSLTGPTYQFANGEIGGEIFEAYTKFLLLTVLIRP